MILLFAALAAFGVAAATFEDGRLEPVFACALLYFARSAVHPISDREFIDGVAALFLMCSFLDREHWMFHLVSGVFVIFTATIASSIV